MASYLYAVQTDEGREVAAWSGEVDKVGEVTAEVAKGRVRLVRDGTVLAAAPAPSGTALTLHRWPADDKLAAPVSHPVAAT